MRPLTAVLSYFPRPSFEETLNSLAKSPFFFESIVVVCPGAVPLKREGIRILEDETLYSSAALGRILKESQSKYLLLLPGAERISLLPGALERFVETAETTGAGVVFSDFYEGGEGEGRYHPLNDYQPGSVRDDFAFGPVILLSTDAARKALCKYGPIPAVKSAGFYDLRLKVSIDHSIHHLGEPLYFAAEGEEAAGDEKLFAYLDPRRESVQKEMEAVFTDYLKRIGAYLPPGSYREVPAGGPFPVEASVVIPVRNRERTVGEAVKSALAQETDFPFNVMVVDNYSTDQTSSILSVLAGRHPALRHIVPARTDLGIGGCWNEALRHRDCGRYAVQLDSDDLYAGVHALQKIVAELRRGIYALVIGSYTLVDSNLKEIPPGLLDHREWTDMNGRNNALRINGLGAPRGFHTGLMRKIGFLNASYGEDYAAALRLSREYRVGRIYESLYLCRRWSGNTDAALSLEAANRNDAFKDQIRTEEIMARQKMNRGEGKILS